MKIKALYLVIPAMFCSSIHAKSSTNNWDSDIVENYLAPMKGNEITKLTDIEKKSRWYSTFRLKGTSQYTNGSSLPEKEGASLQASMRLRGKTMLNNDIGVVGDFWLKAQENYTRIDGKTTDPFSGDFEDSTSWEQFRIGAESNKYGALMLAKHTATWGVFTTDIGVQGLLDTQGDAGGKNGQKIIYKNHFDNNIFLNMSYDTTSTISGVDIGYQTADIYAFSPDSYGIYLSIHNGQPLLENGAGNFIIGNADSKSRTKSDSQLNRHDSNQYTYSISGYKQIDVKHKFAFNIAYSKMADNENANLIKSRGYASEGLGLSGTMSYQIIPEGFHGFSPIMTISHDEFGSTFAPELQYFITPNFRVWGAHVINSGGQNMTKAEFQYDF